jgi:hypothetical protein
MRWRGMTTAMTSGLPDATRKPKNEATRRILMSLAAVGAATGMGFGVWPDSSAAGSLPSECGPSRGGSMGAEGG